MPNGYPDGSPVTWGRYTAERDALSGRVASLEDFADRRRGMEAELKALTERVDRMNEVGEQRRERSWSIGTVLLASILAPLLVSVLTIWLHIRGG